MEIGRIGETPVEKSQKIILDYYKNNKTRGIFYVPELEVYSADILVKNQHPILVVDEGEDLKGHKIDYIENDKSLAYIVSEIAFVLKRDNIGLVYDYTINGEEGHTHSFRYMMIDVLEYGDKFEPITEYGNYSKQELELIRYTSNNMDLNFSKRFLKFPYKLKGKEVFTNDIEELYDMVVDNYNDITVEFDDRYYNKNQIDIINMIIEYQKYEEEKERRMEVDIKTKLYHGLPDSRIYKLASKITVVSYNGTEIVIKDRGLENEGELILDKNNKFNNIDELLEEVVHKELTIYAEFYNNKEVRKILEEI